MSLNEKLIHIRDGYYQSEEGYFFTNSKGIPLRFTDFTITSIGRKIEISAGDERRLFYSVRLKNVDGVIRDVEILTDKWSDLCREIEKSHHEFQIFSDLYKIGIRDKFKRVATEILNAYQAQGKITTQILYKRWGWGDLYAGRRIFYHAGRSDCACQKLLHPFINDVNARQQYLLKAMEIFNVGDLSVSMPVVIHSLASYAMAIFEDAGYPIEHSLMLLGKSGYRKTSLAQVVCSPFVPLKSRIHSVRSTEAALYSLLNENFDDTLVIDDFNFEGSRRDVNEKQRNLRNIIRAVSDGVIRAKFGTDRKAKEFHVRTLVLITGETKMSSQLASSELRYIKVHLDQPLRGDILSQFQINPSLWLHFVSEWIRFLEANYATFLNYVQIEFPKRRSTTELQEGRLIDAFVQMNILAEWLEMFMKMNQLIFTYDGESFSVCFAKIILQIIETQRSSAVTQETHVAYLSEIFNLIGTGKIRIAPTLDHYNEKKPFYVGYRDDDIIMMEKDASFSTVVAAYANRNEFFPASSDEVAKSLKDAGLTVTDKGSNLKKTSSRIPGRPRMLALIESKCENLLDSLPR